LGLPDPEGEVNRFLVRRLGLVVATLFLISVVVFTAAQVLPGDIGRTILGPFALQSQVDQLNHQLGADQPLIPRYAHWLGGYLRGDWGRSYLLNIPARELVLQRLVNSLYLALFAMALTVPISIAVGVVAALHERKLLDRVVTITGLSLIALPEFVTGVVLIVIFAVKLQWLPVTSTVPTLDPLSWFREFLLPAMPLAILLFGYISRMARAGTIEVLRSNYIRTARLKGLPRRTIVLHHVLRNALLPTITVVAVQSGYLVGGLVVIETLFNYPGMGKLIYDSAIGHDIPVLEATVLLVAVLLMLANLLADIAYAVLNPRIRLGRAE
jgi:peptide/nickel transport system permease protein